MNLVEPYETENTASTLSEAESVKAVLSPRKLRGDVPLSNRGREGVATFREEIGDILSGRDRKRALVVCGPCSIDDVNSALVFGDRIRRLGEEVSDKVVLVMRTYFEKPRSVVGWKGLLYDPLNDEDGGPSSGLAIARRLAVRLCESGVACATEFLNPLLALYLDDCVSYGSIGSRTVESQIHRELASRLRMPVGMKNGMDGDYRSALNAVRAAQHAHRFFGQDLEGRMAVIESRGNAGAHVILRGGSNGPNFEEKVVEAVVLEGRKLGLERPVVVDCSHGNSGKDHRRQPGVAREVIRQLAEGQGGIAGIMLESHLVEGRQEAEGVERRRFGQSITDACIGWKDTEYLVKSLAESL